MIRLYTYIVQEHIIQALMLVITQACTCCSVSLLHDRCLLQALVFIAACTHTKVGCAHHGVGLLCGQCLLWALMLSSTARAWHYQATAAYASAEAHLQSHQLVWRTWGHHRSRKNQGPAKMETAEERLGGIMSQGCGCRLRLGL
jgi:hypothetical protein